jgi:hypothetical protein
MLFIAYSMAAMIQLCSRRCFNLTPWMPVHDEPACHARGFQTARWCSTGDDHKVLQYQCWLNSRQRRGEQVGGWCTPQSCQCPRCCAQRA